MPWLVWAPLALSLALALFAGVVLWIDEGAAWLDTYVIIAVPLSMVVLPGVAIWAAVNLT